MKKSLKDRIGEKVNHLVLVEILQSDKPNKRGLFRCDCGTLKEAQLNAVIYGSTKSCGCMMRSYYASGTVKTHGMHSSPTYRSWTCMKSRCLNPKTPGYERYGGRGIKVCQRWQDSFEAFLADMGERPAMDFTLDRIDNDGDYEPGNCRWADKKAQQHNRECARLLTHNGETMTMLQWAERLGMSWSALDYRSKRGWTDEQIITTPRKNYPM